MCRVASLSRVKYANANSVSRPDYYEINLIKNKSLLRRAKNSASPVRIGSCSQLSPFPVNFTKRQQVGDN